MPAVKIDVMPEEDLATLTSDVAVNTTRIAVQQPALQQQQQQQQQQEEEEEEGAEDMEANFSALAKAVARLEAEASEHRLCTERRNRAVGVPEPGAGALAHGMMTVCCARVFLPGDRSYRWRRLATKRSAAHCSCERGSQRAVPAASHDP